MRVFIPDEREMRKLGTCWVFSAVEEADNVAHVEIAEILNLIYHRDGIAQY